MKSNQSVLMDAIENERTKQEMEQARDQMWSRFSRWLRTPHWFCKDCDAPCERIEDDHGQPAHCGRCGSHRLEWRKPVIVDDTQLIHPGEL